MVSYPFVSINSLAACLLTTVLVSIDLNQSFFCLPPMEWPKVRYLLFDTSHRSSFSAISGSFLWHGNISALFVKHWKFFFGGGARFTTVSYSRRDLLHLVRKLMRSVICVSH